MSSEQAGAASVPTVPGYSVGREIGKGSFAVVYLGTPLGAAQRSVAVKSVSRSKLTKKLLENLESEISILKGIRHPHIVSLLDKTESESQIHLIMEYCPLGDLSVFIKRRDKVGHEAMSPYICDVLTQYPSTPGAGIHETLVRHFLRQLAAALRFLRSQNLMHRDVKPQNLLLAPPSARSVDGRATASALPTLKLADFGFARYLQTSSLAETLCGSPLYMAPEILQYERYDATADLWSTGTVLYEMLIGKPPYRASNHVELLRKIIRSEDVIRFPSDVTLPGDIKDLIRSLLKRNPRQRLTFDAFFDNAIVSPSPSAHVAVSESQASTTVGTLMSVDLQRPEVANTNSSHDVNRLSRETNTHHKGPEALQPYADASSLPLQTVARPDVETGLREPSGSAKDLIDYARQQAPRTELKHRHEVTQGAGEVDKDSDGDYVVVEKRTVELNAFADAVSRPGISRTSSLARRQKSSRPLQSGHTNGTSRPALSQAVPVPADRRVAGKKQTGALAQALSIVGQQLFGNASPPRWLGTMVNNPSRAALAHYGRSMAIGDMAEILQRSDETVNRAEALLIDHIGRIAMRATIVYDFAELKLAQLSAIEADDNLEKSFGQLTDQAIVSIAQEAIVLYLKSLRLLHTIIDKVREWMSQQSASVVVGGRLNKLVQWTREKYNEALDKGETLQQRKNRTMVAISQPLALDDVTVERLLFDRALDLVRAAAVNEMTGDDLMQCEDDYEVAILMLEAILDSPGKDDSGQLDGEALISDDRQLIERWLDLTRQRHEKLRVKMESILAQSGYVATSLEGDRFGGQAKVVRIAEPMIAA